VSTTADVGNVAVVGSSIVAVTGVAASARSGTVTIWTAITPQANNLWLPIGRALILLENESFILQETTQALIQEVSTTEATWGTVVPDPDTTWTPVAA
jgi:hypothetical protein